LGEVHAGVLVVDCVIGPEGTLSLTYKKEKDNTQAHKLDLSK
jgi:hypothetical protein